VWGLGWGYGACVPVCGDYDGDGVSDLALYDPTNGKWYIRRAGGAVLVFGKAWEAVALCL